MYKICNTYEIYSVLCIMYSGFEKIFEKYALAQMSFKEKKSISCGIKWHYMRFLL